MRSLALMRITGPSFLLRHMIAQLMQFVPDSASEGGIIFVTRLAPLATINRALS